MIIVTDSNNNNNNERERLLRDAEICFFIRAEIKKSRANIMLALPRLQNFKKYILSTKP